jgi:hypothetical protein
MELAIAIAANVVLGAVLLGLFAWQRSHDGARLAGGVDALATFRRQFPDAIGVATVASDARSALLALRDGAGIGLLHLHGRRWNAREILPGDLRAVTVTQGNTITLTLADFGWPRARVRIEDPDTRAAWLARLEESAAGRVAAHLPVTRHA